MKEVEFIEKCGLLGASVEEFLLKTAESHGLFAEIKTVTKDNAPETVEEGEYLILGEDEKLVQMMVSSYSNAVRFPFEVLRQQESPDVFPKCTVIRIIPTFRGIVDVLEKILDTELMKVLFAKHEFKLPEIIDRRDFMILYREYRRSIEALHTNSSEEDLKYFLEIVASNKTMEEYEKEHGKNDARYGDMFTKEILNYADKLADNLVGKKVSYKPVSDNCVSKEHMLDFPYSTSRIAVSHGKDGETIRRIDEELGKYPEIKWSLQEKAEITPYGQNEYQYWHGLRYPTKYTARVAGIVNKIEKGLEDYCKIYIKGDKDNVIASSIPIELFNRLAKEMAKDGVEYYYDECSTYVAQDMNSIGICVESETDAKLLFQLEIAMIKSLARDSHLGEKDK